MKRAEVKGAFGEDSVRNLLLSLQCEAHGPLKDMKFLQNVAIPKRNTTTQVDFIVLTHNRFICLEVKAWEGKININPVSNTWFVEYGSRRFNTGSPLKQNASHIRALDKVSRYSYESFVLFPLNPRLCGTCYGVGNSFDFITYLMSDSTKYYTTDEINREFEFIKEVNAKNYVIELRKTAMREFKMMMKDNPNPFEGLGIENSYNNYNSYNSYDDYDEDDEDEYEW